MTLKNLRVIAPKITGESFNEAEVLGSAVWLWMHSKQHRTAPLHILSALLLPAIKHRQFTLVTEQDKPIFYMAWAEFSYEAERRYLKNPPQDMPVEDWASGDRIWILDWIAPFGHTHAMKRLAASSVFFGCHMRSLYHRGEENGLRIMSFHGAGVTPAEANFWRNNNPVALDPSSRNHDE